jgi:uncharacterized protein YqgQ
MRMTLQDVAQTMLDRYGFFVVKALRPQRIGVVREEEINAGYTHGILAETERFTAKFKIIAEATREDVAKQDAIIGIVSEGHAYCYRAVAE